MTIFMIGWKAGSYRKQRFNSKMFMEYEVRQSVRFGRTNKTLQQWNARQED